MVDKLVEECGENVDEAKLTEIALAENENSYKCSFSALYLVLFWILFTINVGGICMCLLYLFSQALKKYVYSWNNNLLNS